MHYQFLLDSGQEAMWYITNGLDDPFVEENIPEHNLCPVPGSSP
jgi:hypothetical protein